MTATLDRPISDAPTGTPGPPVRTVASRPAPEAAGLTAAQVEELGRRLDAIRDRVVADRGERDAAYIHSVIRTQRYLEIGGRALLFAGVLPPAWIAGTALLSASKIIENMELGHNIMHGQWDWMRDPKIHSTTWDWDNTSPAEAWKYTHNYEHHTYTNVVGRDRDVGYGILRMSDEQEWRPYFLLNPLWNALLATFFQWGVALHDLEAEKIAAGERSLRSVWPQLKAIGRKVRRQFTKDYIAFPALAGPFLLPVLAGNATANLVRNLWSHAVIFCGHFPDGAVQFSEEQLEDETRGQWYLRQMLGSANLEGGPLFHLMTGNLSFQIEHHLFPDLPSNRYAEIAPEIRAICAEYGLEYTSGTLPKQYLQVLRTINRLALPPKKA
ncbi:acyl-CoA desaturase [Pseudonocardia sp. KRD-184]|uniref:Acyl-CoA desaturase n=1 Tax=Pseudonocardia oceani TaxID=2792013 RepID=A0ABS6UE47_9PSEU|nr:acyl-CoA desaturase [Pseudonocardia oceani]MBW0091843.1 acyl-CoA desaturase [Pseudonocardia oceani]MBW0098325.1 acyl-CoA desaturase [Pseudonocardia oceani]MBW0110870.1 acyl-CoA desaturase [Pseudonocardia oceani]MBW0121970.1 acyl-CoA desaturase [Pseudonocardia oceani]MBW0130500.1 acyl-CoA desaturase [Pseudonocardia oceani]